METQIDVMAVSETALDDELRELRRILNRLKEGFERSFENHQVSVLPGFILGGNHRFSFYLYLEGGKVQYSEANSKVADVLKSCGVGFERCALKITNTANAAPPVRAKEKREEVELWDKTRLPPLTVLDGWLKQITPSDLGTLERISLAFAFPLFLGAHASVRIDKARADREYCRRRYSGDSHEPFPRARYHSVCQDATGEDNVTLLAELNAYAMPHITGLCVARRSSTPDKIEILFRGLPGEPNPLYLALNEPETAARIIAGNPLAEDALGEIGEAMRRIVPPDQQVVIDVKCSVHHQSIDGVLDLRLPPARQWLAEHFSNPPDDFFGAALRHLASDNNVDLSSIRGDHWGHIAPLLVAPSFGGNSFTDLLGWYLRSLGVSGLVFPSARNDHIALIKDGELSFFYGWNFVDYRGATRPEGWRPELTSIMPLEGAREIIDVREGDTAGSVELRGSLAAARESNEHGFLIYIMEHGRGIWAAEGGQVGVRGFHWFDRRYSLLDPGFHATCSQCGFVSEDREVATSSLSCPQCGYYGDL